ncbi:unnamed protein product [Kuraishia capsulata CBS 1993]|uniref:Golgi to ER traffic protein 4 n=1 Tax=Kuraishia capsulata CBS 1993 TaxID=1382522 RepID=W6MIJ9_9ASCO|nr:uncharacterized protein KUCA_T00002270001 [Kuraishia capsulata CBS 1993]CDK26299.1 unnamed protein product [Kuraishia capsulata CBS 1993]
MSAQHDKKLALYLQRCKAKVDAGAHYEAQQSVRTYVNRYVAGKKFADATELLFQSCKMLIEAQKYDESADLLLYLLEIFEKESPSEDQVKKDQLPQVVEILNLIPDTDANLPSLTKEISRWAAESTGSALGDSQLNYVLGEKLFYSELKENMNLAEQCLLASQNEEALKLLLELNLQVLRNGGPELVPVIAPRLVVPYLLMENFKFATKSLAVLIEEYSSRGELVESGGMKTFIFEESNFKMLNFLQLLVQFAQRAGPENADNFKILFGRYRSLFDESLEKKVNAIGEIYFGVSVVAKAVNPLQNMMSGLFGR